MNTKTNLIIDAGILAGFLAAYDPELTGIAIHEWLSLALAVIALLHLLLHWQWVVCAVQRFFKRWQNGQRLNFIVDLLLLLAFSGVTVSGIVISRAALPALGLSLPGTSAWRAVHSVTADASLILTGLHFALHWRWIVCAVRTYVIQPVSRLLRRRPAALQPDMPELISQCAKEGKPC